MASSESDFSADNNDKDKKSDEASLELDELSLSDEREDALLIDDADEREDAPLIDDADEWEEALLLMEDK
eukprot:scaffold3198_cov213-Alexandrium_tamarense.AAC.29